MTRQEGESVAAQSVAQSKEPAIADRL